MIELVKSVLFPLIDLAGVNQVFRAWNRRKLSVVCYHGITEERSPCEYRGRVTLSRMDFQNQLRVLLKYYHAIALQDLIDVIAGVSELPDNSLLVTFDDGYQNNYSVAAPILSCLGVPAVFHITTGLIGTDEVLWTQALDERIIRWKNSVIPDPLTGRMLPVPEQLEGRIKLAAIIRDECKRLPNSDRLAYLAKIGTDDLDENEEWLVETYRFMTWANVKSLARQGFEIGAHTVTHPILTKVDDVTLDFELRQAKATIESHTNMECRSLAYPNGGVDDVSRRVQQAARIAGYKTGFSLREQGCDIQLNPLDIDRICVNSGMGNSQMKARLSGSTRLRF